MKKMLYIRPEMVIIPIKVHPLLTGSPFVDGETTGGGGVNDVPVEDWVDDEGL